MCCKLERGRHENLPSRILTRKFGSVVGHHKSIPLFFFGNRLYLYATILDDFCAVINNGQGPYGTSTGRAVGEDLKQRYHKSRPK